MPFTRLQIQSLVLNVLGKKSLNSPADAGEFGDALDRGFDFIYQTILINDDWRFATKVQLLNLLPDAPIVPQWAHILQLPSDYIEALRTYPAVDYEIYEDKIYTGVQSLILEYRYLVPVEKLPIWFVRFFVYDLAMHLSISVPLKTDYAAKLEEMRGDAYAKALTSNTRSRPSKNLMNSPVISARGGTRFNNEDITTLN